MLSKAKRKALTALHILLCDRVDEDGKLNVHVFISSKAVIAAQNYVNTCCQHAAFIAGRGMIED